MRLLALTLALSVVSITTGFAEDITRALSTEQQTQLAQAQQATCGPYEAIAAALASKYHEGPVARMMSDRGFVIEVLASADGSTFTVLAVNANGTACGLATGSAFELVPASAAPVPGTDS